MMIVGALLLPAVTAAVPSLYFSAPDCVAGFISAQFNVRQFDQYATWFDENSTMILPQTGVFKGVDDILEYSKFIFPGSPYISTNGLLKRSDSLVSFDEEKRSCVFMSLVHSRFEMSEIADNKLIETAWMNTVEWRFDDQKVGYLHVYYPADFLGSFFSTFNTPAADNFVCQTMSDACPDVWAANGLTSLGECAEKLVALPLADGEDFFVDGNSSSCRKLHAVFAATNSNHCAHLSFKPMADSRGKVKCQESAQLQASDLFTEADQATFAAFATVELGFEPDQYWRLSPCQTQADCPAAGDVEEHPTAPTGNFYSKDTQCVFGANRRLLFGPTPPRVGVCMPA